MMEPEDLPDPTPVHNFMVGFGSATTMDEDGVVSTPLVAVVVNDGSLQLVLDPRDALQLTLEVVKAIPDALAGRPEDSAKLAKKLRATTARSPWDNPAFAAVYVGSALFVLLLGVLTGEPGEGFNGMVNVLALAGLSYLVGTLLRYFARWKLRRKS